MNFYILNVFLHLNNCMESTEGTLKEKINVSRGFMLCTMLCTGARTVELGRAICVRHLKCTVARVPLAVVVFHDGHNLSRTFQSPFVSTLDRNKIPPF